MRTSLQCIRLFWQRQNCSVKSGMMEDTRKKALGVNAKEIRRVRDSIDTFDIA